MKDYRKDYPVSVFCETLGVSLSGYSAWKKRPMSNHQREDHQLAEHIQEVYHSCRQVYGSLRIHAELRAQSITSSRKRVARLMREQGLSACRRQHRTTKTKSEPGARVAPNLLDQDFTATRPDEKWTGDIPAVWTGCRIARAFQSYWICSPDVSSDGRWRRSRTKRSLRRPYA